MWQPDVPLDVHRLLRHGEITECEHIPWGSNYTFCVTLRFDGAEGRGIYKPRKGERPLWDFPHGTLYRREFAAFVASQALGWLFIPATVVRQGPYGVGSVQLFVEAEPPGSIRALQDSDDIELARVAAFDIIANNADRKAGHLLRDPAGKLWGIDHGLCFNVSPKVRTVLLHYCGQPVPTTVLAELRRFREDASRVDGLLAALQPAVTEEEANFFLQRVDWLIEHGIYPRLDGYRAVPWPPF